MLARLVIKCVHFNEYDMYIHGDIRVCKINFRFHQNFCILFVEYLIYTNDLFRNHDKRHRTQDPVIRITKNSKK